MELPADHRIISLMLEQALKKKYWSVQMFPYPPGLFKELPRSMSYGDFRAAYHCKLTVNNPRQHLEFVIQFSHNTVEVCRFIRNSNLEKIFGFNFQNMITQNHTMQKDALNNMIKTMMDELRTDINQFKIK